MAENVRSVFITWYPSCRRSDALAAALGGESHLIHRLAFKQPLYAPFKYVLQTMDTVRILRARKPDVVFVASPPVIAALVVWLYCRLTGARCVIDAHTGVFDDPRWTWMMGLSRSLSRRSLTTIVTNDHLRGTVEGWGAHSIVIGTVPVEFPEGGSYELPPGFNVMVVNTFSQDEPLAEILEAARQLPQVHFHVTGSSKHARSNVSQAAPENVRLTGWISDEDYAALLRTVDAVACLTTHNHTMQRGAYEAMALGKPLITSDWGILRETFCRGTVHVDNSVEQIISAVRTISDRRSEFETEMVKLREERAALFRSQLGELSRLF